MNAEDMAAAKRETYHHGNLRAALVEAVGELVRETGIETASTRACAKRLGVAPSAVFRHFRDKRALMTAYAAQGFREMAGGIRERQDVASSDPTREFRAMAESYLDFALSKPDLFRVMFRRELLDPADPELLDATGELDTVTKGGVVEIGRRDTDVDLCAWAVVHGLATLAIDSHLEAELPESLAERKVALLTVLRRMAPLFD